jgi:hypothetical protein
MVRRPMEKDLYLKFKNRITRGGLTKGLFAEGVGRCRNCKAKHSMAHQDQY